MIKITKICSKCKKELLIKQFCKNKAQKDGLANWCKECKKIYKREHYKKDKIKMKAKNKIYYEHHKVEIIKYCKEYQKKHKKEIKEYQKEYRKNFKVKINEFIKNKRKNDIILRIIHEDLFRLKSELKSLI